MVREARGGRVPGGKGEVAPGWGAWGEVLDGGAWEHGGGRPGVGGMGRGPGWGSMGAWGRSPRGGGHGERSWMGEHGSMGEVAPGWGAWGEVLDGWGRHGRFHILGVHGYIWGAQPYSQSNGGCFTDDFTSIDLGYIYIHTCDLSSVGDDRGGPVLGGHTPEPSMLGGRGDPRDRGPRGRMRGDDLLAS